MTSIVNNWAVELESRNINFQYIPGVKNTLTDTLSRLIEIDEDIKLPPEEEGKEFGSCAVVDVDINTMEKDKVEIIPNELWLSNHPNICIYTMTADLSNKGSTLVMPFVIVNFSPTKYLHLPKDQVVVFAEKTVLKESYMK